MKTVMCLSLVLIVLLSGCAGAKPADPPTQNITNETMSPNTTVSSNISTNETSITSVSPWPYVEVFSDEPQVKNVPPGQEFIISYNFGANVGPVFQVDFKPSGVVTLVDRQASTLDNSLNGTQWFLFKAVAVGTTNLTIILQGHLMPVDFVSQKIFTINVLPPHHGANATGSQNFTPQVIDLKMLHSDDIALTPGGPGFLGGDQSANAPIWPTLGVNTTSVPTFNGTVAVSCRTYIETRAGEARNEFLFLDVTAAPALDDPLKVTYNLSGLPGGVKVNLTQNGYGGIGRPNYRTASSFIVISIPAEVNPGEYDYTIHLSYQGIDFGVVPCVLKVFPPAAETFGVTYVPGEYLYVWGTTNSPVPDDTSVTSQLEEWRQTAIVNGSTWSANFTLGEGLFPATLNFGNYSVYTYLPPNNNRIVIGAVSFSIAPPPPGQ